MLKITCPYCGAELPEENTPNPCPKCGATWASGFDEEAALEAMFGEEGPGGHKVVELPYDHHRDPVFLVFIPGLKSPRPARSLSRPINSKEC